VEPTASLKKLQKKVAARSSSLPAELAKALPERINDLIMALTEAHGVLSAGTADKLNVAAKKIVYCRWITGHEWWRYLANFGPGADAGKEINEAFAKDARPLVNEIARLLALQPAPNLVRKDEDYVLPCAACGESAVTYRLRKDGVQANSISSVFPTTYWKGEEAQRLVELLAEGGARAVLDYLASPGRGSCDAFCPQCDRIYCREHYAVDEIWSGSWHEASYATCPLGHEREFK
jgi:hypothetical protein